MGALAPYIPEIITGIGTAGAGALSGLTSPTPYQPMHPYGGSLSPEATLGEGQMDLRSLLAGLLHHAGQPTTLPDASVRDVPTMSGGDLPFSFGGQHGLSAPTPLPPYITDPNAPVSLSPTGASPSPTAGLSNTSWNPPGSSDAPNDQRAPVQMAAAPVRQKFGPSNFPSANALPQSSTPTMAALELLRQAATAA